MMLVTFDHNLLIDLESKDDRIGDALCHLVSLHEVAQIKIRVAAIGASERLLDKTYAPDFSAFQERVQKLSQREFELLKPLGYWNVTYWDWCIWGGGEGTREYDLDQAIHTVLFPEIESKWADYAKTIGVDPNQAAQTNSREWQRWRNRKCDVLTLWSHIYHAGDVFVTNDKHFHHVTKKQALINLGAKQILYPTDAVSMLSSVK